MTLQLLLQLSSLQFVAFLLLASSWQQIIVYNTGNGQWKFLRCFFSILTSSPLPLLPGILDLLIAKPATSYQKEVAYTSVITTPILLLLIIL